MALVRRSRHSLESCAKSIPTIFDSVQGRIQLPLDGIRNGQRRNAVWLTAIRGNSGSDGAQCLSLEARPDQELGSA